MNGLGQSNGLLLLRRRLELLLPLSLPLPLPLPLHVVDAADFFLARLRNHAGAAGIYYTISNYVALSVRRMRRSSVPLAFRLHTVTQ